MEFKVTLYFVFICMHMLTCVKPSVRRRNRDNRLDKIEMNVDYLLESMIQNNKDKRLLWDAINVIQDVLQNTAYNNTDDLSIKSHTTGDFSKNMTELLKSTTEDFDTKTEVLLSGFHQEKAAVRHLIANVVQKLDTAMGRIAENDNTVHDLRLNVTASVHEMEQQYDSVLTDLQENRNQNVDDLRTAVRYLVVRGNGYVQHGKSYYKYFNQTVPWNEAQEICNKDLGYLVELEDDEELSFVKTISKENHVWVGGTDATPEGNWIWVTSGKPIPSSLWIPGEPNNFNGTEHCAHISKLLDLNDLTCTRTYVHFVCEISPQTSII